MNIKIKKADKADSLLLFDWTNDPITRANSFSSNTITMEEHTQWFSHKLKDPNSSIYIFYLENMPIGVVRFDTKDETFVGVTIAPEHRGKGMASKIISLGCIELWKESDNQINAYILEDNIPSLKAFEKAGFHFREKGFHNCIPCIILYKNKNE